VPAAVPSLCANKLKNMQPLFPRKNWAINTLIEFRSGKTLFEFTEYFRKTEDEINSWDIEHLEFQISHLNDLFDGLKDEMNQIIHTSNSITITKFFEELKSSIISFNLNTVNEEYFWEIAEKWNKTKYENFLEELEKKELEFFDKPERIKYKHLEKYRTSAFNVFTSRVETLTIENKNFFCIEEKPKLIDLEHLDKYLSTLKKLTLKFNNVLNSELKLYEEGKLIISPIVQATTYDKLISSFKNNKVIVGILIGFIIYGGLSNLIKLTKENKENLFGKDGLIKLETDTVGQKLIMPVHDINLIDSLKNSKNSVKLEFKKIGT
jgi:Txe/YoeB family toxin of Txe-Axe toxin-antitoxin module